MSLRLASSVAALCGVLASSTAYAQESTLQPTTVSATTEAPRRFTAGMQLELLPQGELHTAIGATHRSAALTTAFGLGGLFAFDLVPHFSVGVAPRVAFHVNPRTASTDAMTEYDLRARAAVHGNVVATVSLFAFAEPGYSWIVPSEGDAADGFVAAFGGGVSYDLGADAFVSAEVGYQLGFQSVSSEGFEAETHVDVLHLGFAGGARF